MNASQRDCERAEEGKGFFVDQFIHFTIYENSFCYEVDLFRLKNVKVVKS